MSIDTFEIKLEGLSKVHNSSANMLAEKCEFRAYHIPHSFISDHGPVYWNIFCSPPSNRHGEVTDVILFDKLIYLDIGPGYLWKFDDVFTKGISASKLMFVVSKLLYDDSNDKIDDYVDKNTIYGIHVYECDEYAIVRPVIK